MPISTSSLKSIAWGVLNKGYQIDGVLDEEGNSLLHLVMKHNLDDENLIWAILSRSPAIDMKNNAGLTQLDLALECGNQNILQIIHKVISFRKYSLLASLNRRVKDRIPMEVVSEYLPCDNGIFDLPLSKYLLSGVHDDYLDWCEDNAYAQKKVSSTSSSIYYLIV